MKICASKFAVKKTKSWSRPNHPDSYSSESLLGKSMAALPPLAAKMGVSAPQRWRGPQDPRAGPPGPCAPLERCARAWRPAAATRALASPPPPLLFEGRSLVNIILNTREHTCLSLHQMEQPFAVRLGDCKLKLTAKPKALEGAFGAKIIDPFLAHINKKKTVSAEPILIADLESVTVSDGSGAQLAAFCITETLPSPDLSCSVLSLVPPGAAGSTLSVELLQRATRKLKINCAGVSLSADLPGMHVHLSLHETVVKQFIHQYNNKVNSERPSAKSNVTLQVVCLGSSPVCLLSCSLALSLTLSFARARPRGPTPAALASSHHCAGRGALQAGRGAPRYRAAGVPAPPADGSGGYRNEAHVHRVQQVGVRQAQGRG